MCNEKGQSLVEVIVAIVVSILVIQALVIVTILSIRNASFSKNSAQATKLAQGGIEQIRILRDRDGSGSVNYGVSPNPTASKFSDLWGISFDCTTSNNCYFYLNSAGVLTGGNSTTFETIPPSFQRQFLIEDVVANQKKITVIVRWTDQSGSHDSKLVTILGKL
ncbi:hypothetical protein M1437_02390 [Patescibacteria group bacterium]|nr:hypothetical protein [Patescibacteria group bacterium]